MFNSAVLDVMIGLTFTFLAVSLAAGTVVEAIASMWEWRSKTLLQGIKDLLNDQDFKDLALDIYKHALINPQDAGTAKNEKDLTHKPSYIDPKLFADALVDVANIKGDSPEEIKSAIDTKITKIKNPQLNRLLNGIVDQTAGHFGKMRHELAVWFDNSMDRIGGDYKRKTQKWSFIIALIIAIVLNISSISVFKALWLRPMLAKTLSPTPNMTPSDALAILETQGFPIGWSDAALKSLGSWNGLAAALKNLWSWNGLTMSIGWLITAAATLFGAPFWFDTLQRFVRLKGSGPSPAEKRSGAGASA